MPQATTGLENAYAVQIAAVDRIAARGLLSDRGGLVGVPRRRMTNTRQQQNRTEHRHRAPGPVGAPAVHPHSL
ncbi:MAG TPA: hypothetical protein VIS29_21065 [Streptomyces sp.]